MNLDAVGVFRALVLEAGLAVLVASYCFERREGSGGEGGAPAVRASQSAFDTWFLAIAVLAAIGYFNFGNFRYGEGIVHRHEQYHFYFGSKYLEEVRYDALYDATVAAMAERHAGRAARIEPRDPMTFEIVPSPLSNGKAEAARQRFTDERWESFVREVEHFFVTRRLSTHVLTDHGNTGSPTWAMVASLLTRTIPLVGGGAPLASGAREETSPGPFDAMNLYAIADVVLLAILFATVFWAFGRRVGLVTMTIGLSVPIVHDWLGGSILRMDWIFALGMASCFLAKKKHALSGAFMGYAVATKLLAGLMVAPIGMAMVAMAIRERRIRREHVVVVGVAVVTALAFVGASAAYFGGFQIWRDYDARMLVTLHEHYYSNQHSFRDVFLQLHHVDALRDLGWAPSPVAASQEHVRIEDYPVSFGLARAAFVLAVGWCASRHPIERAIAFGPLVVYAMLVTNLYYWQIALFGALGFAQGYREDARTFGYLVATYAFVLTSLVFERTGPGGLLGYFGSYRLFWLTIALVVVELAHTERGAPIWARVRAWLASGPDEPAPALAGGGAGSPPKPAVEPGKPRKKRRG